MPHGRHDAMIENDSQTSWRPLTLLAAVIAVAMFVFPLAVRFPLLDPDEGLHASIAQDMIERGDWITPHFLGRPFLDKPIFYFWVQAASLRLFGESETAIRLPGLMFGLLGAMTTGLLAWRLFDRATGIIAFILYSTTILPTAMAQAAAHDVALIPWVNLTLLFLWEARGEGRGERGEPFIGLARPPRFDRKRIVNLSFAGFFLGLAILTKGLMGVAVVAVAWGGYSLILLVQRYREDSHGGARRTRPTLRSLATLVAQASFILLVAVLIAAPWYLAVESQHPGFLRYYFIDRHVLGLATGTQPHGDQPWWYYLPILLGGGLPWIGYLGKSSQWSVVSGQLTDAANQKSEIRNQKSPAPLLWCWLIGWTLLLTVARSKLATYLWPAFPPVAILAAVVWAKAVARGSGFTVQEGRVAGEVASGEWRAASEEDPSSALASLNPFAGSSLRFQERAGQARPLNETLAARPSSLSPRPSSLSRTFVWSSLSGPIVLPAVLAAVQWTFDVRFAWPVWAAVVFVAILTPLPLLPWRAGNPLGALTGAALSMAAQFIVVMTMVMPAMAGQFSARELAEHYNRLGRLPPRLLVTEERIGSFVFYLSPPLRAGLKPGQLERLFRDNPPSHWQPGDVLALPERGLERASRYLHLGNTPYDSVGRYRLYRMSPKP